MIFPSRGRFMATSYCLIWNLTLGQSVQLVDSFKPPEIYLSSGINMPFLRMKSIFLKPHESTNQSCKPMTSTLLFPLVSVSLGGATLWPPQWGQWELLLLPAMPAIRMPSEWERPQPFPQERNHFFICWPCICMACLAMCPVNSQLLAEQMLTLTLTRLVTSCVAATSCQHHLKLGLKIQVRLAKIILCLWHLWQFLGLETPWKGIQGDLLRLRGKWGFPLSPSDFLHVCVPHQIPGEVMNGDKSVIPSGNLSHSYWKLLFIVSFSMKNGDFP